MHFQTGHWLDPFETKWTTPEPFHCLNGSKSTVEMMHGSDYFEIGYDGDLDAQVKIM